MDAKRELDETRKLSEATLVAVAQFCHCLKCPTYPRGEMAVYCLRGKTDHWVQPVSCKCPSCHVYQMGKLHGTDYYCTEGVAGAKLKAVGGAVGVAASFLASEIEKGNPGKRIPERLMAPPSYIDKTQDDITVPEKVPGW